MALPDASDRGFPGKPASSPAAARDRALPEAPRRPVLVCFAVREEHAFFKPSPGSKVLVTGIGRRNAVRALEAALAQDRPRLVLTCGFAGALRPGVPVGTVLFAVDADAGLSAALIELGGKAARFHCADRVAVTAEEKRALHQATGADAVEMESESICRVCKERGIPSATIRVVSDTAEQDLPLDFNVLMGPSGGLNFRKLAWQVIRSPGKVPALLRLQRDSRRAARRLGEVLQELLHRKCAGIC